jgi:N-methylhydantoinase B
LTLDDLGSGGALLLDSIEIDELKYPIAVFVRRLATDSEGAGRHRGAPGLAVEYGPLDCSLEAIYANDGAITPMSGARGGSPGARSAQFKRERSGELTEVDTCGPVTIETGERLVSQTSGGGGYGAPEQRDPARVAADVAEGWITRERALSAYGVALDDSGAVDAEQTAANRLR